MPIRQSKKTVITGDPDDDVPLASAYPKQQRKKRGQKRQSAAKTTSINDEEESPPLQQKKLKTGGVARRMSFKIMKQWSREDITPPSNNGTMMTIYW